MNVVITRGQNQATLTIEGRVDANTYPELEKYLKNETDSGNYALILDIAGLEFISSAGLRVLIGCYKTIKPKNGHIILCATRPLVKEILNSTNITQLFEFFDTVAEAEAALKK
ncbi:MAG: STAS domain-containing protein [Candidatus Ozemobacteraceae bacterium]